MNKPQEKIESQLLLLLVYEQQDGPNKIYNIHHTRDDVVGWRVTIVVIGRLILEFYRSIFSRKLKGKKSGIFNDGPRKREGEIVKMNV